MSSIFQSLKDIDHSLNNSLNNSLNHSLINIILDYLEPSRILKYLDEFKVVNNTKRCSSCSSALTSCFYSEKRWKCTNCGINYCTSWYIKRCIKCNIDYCDACCKTIHNKPGLYCKNCSRYLDLIPYELSER